MNASEQKTASLNAKYFLPEFTFQTQRSPQSLALS